MKLCDPASVHNPVGPAYGYFCLHCRGGLVCQGHVETQEPQDPPELRDYLGVALLVLQATLLGVLVNILMHGVPLSVLTHWYWWNGVMKCSKLLEELCQHGGKPASLLPSPTWLPDFKFLIYPRTEERKRGWTFMHVCLNFSPCLRI